MKQDSIPASRFKRLAAMVYDGFLIAAILFVATLVALLIRKGQPFGLYHVGFTLYLIFCGGLYVVWCYQHGGQTLGMRAWQIKLISTDYPNMPLSQSIFRYALGVVGFWGAAISLLWCFIDKDKQSLADRWSGTRLISTKSP